MPKQFLLLMVAVLPISLGGCTWHHCHSPPTAQSFRIPAPLRPGCCDQRAAAYSFRQVPVVQNPVSNPLPSASPHVTELPPVPVPSPNGKAQLLPLVGGERTADASTSDFPVQIPQFNLVENRIASGLRPFTGGFDWLQARGYRTAIHLHTPATSTSALRQQAETQGLKYLSMEVTPRGLTKDLVQAFSRTVRDPLNQPVFVFDQDGTLAGAMWYLHFRLTDKLPEAKARTKAGRLGLKEDPTGDGAELWLAINQLLRQ